MTVELIQDGGAEVEQILDGGEAVAQTQGEELEVGQIHGVGQEVEEVKSREGAVAVGRILGVGAEVGGVIGYRKLQSEMVRDGRRTTNMPDVENRMLNMREVEDVKMETTATEK